MEERKRMGLLPVILAVTAVLAAFPALAAETELTPETEENAGQTVDPEGNPGESSLPEGDSLPVENRTGSIRITLTDGAEGSSKKGVEMSCLKVADLVNGEYVLDPVYFDLEVDLNSIANASALEEAAVKLSEAADHSGALLQETDASGETVFEDLETGVYLIEASDDAAYDDVTPFLLSIPTWSEEEGRMVYDLETEPKHTPKPEEPQTPKDAPQTNVNSPVLWCFAGAGIVGLLLLIFNIRWKKKEQ